MSDREEWGPWIEHDGKGCPVPNGIWAKCQFDDGDVVEGYVAANGNPPEYNAWVWIEGWPTIIRYRIRKPRALIQLREMIETLPAPSRQKEDA